MTTEVLERLRATKKAATELRMLGLAERNQILATAKKLLLARFKEVVEANQADLAALEKSATAAFRDRLLFSEDRVRRAIQSLGEVLALPDPLAAIETSRTLVNGLKVRRVPAPLGVLFLIFESRPNVALEAFSLAIKSGNVIFLRGGKESVKTTGAIYAILSEALIQNGVSPHTFWGITDPNRQLVLELLKASDWIDVVIPRGGEGLIQFVVENSRIPILKNDRGLCHVYVHDGADPEMALAIVVNAKTERPGVCNAMETVLVSSSLHAEWIPRLYERLKPAGVEWFGCPRTLAVLRAKDRVNAATAESWNTEYLDLKLNCRVVDNFEAAVEHIGQFGSRHSESIVTGEAGVARKFQSIVDAAAVYWNASTRFTDGFELGLGGELGISTQKLHVRGPVGLRELTSLRWVMDGTGQIRN